jgi:ABC-type lipoprotein release transport system permease subunit
LLLHLAWRGLFHSRVIAVLLCAAVAGGVAFQIPNAANLGGYEAELLDQGLAVGLGDVRVRPREGSWLVDADALASRLGSRPGVVAAVPAFMLAGAIGKRGNYKPALILGVDAGAPRVPFRILAGRGLTGDERGIVAGITVADRVGATVGDEVQLRVIFGAVEQVTSLDDTFGRYTMNVRGLAAGTFLGSESVVVDRKLLAGDLGKPHAASAVLVHLADHDAARVEAAAIERAFSDVEARAWRDDSQFLRSALEGSAAIRLVSRTMVVLAVLIPVWALLYVDVLHRRRHIAIVNALGFSRLDVFLVYLAQAAIAGAIGVAVGCAAGWGLIAWFGGHPIFASADFVIAPVADAATFVWPSVLVFAATLAAAVVPAWRAARLAPARVLRGVE